MPKGAPRGIDNCHAWTRLIPAHAGSTWGDGPLPQDRGAHPRSRGEHSTTGPQSDSVTGSSPLTRGAREHTLNNGLHSGLIPAHAGSTGRDAPMSLPISAHPRSRGEHLDE